MLNLILMNLRIRFTLYIFIAILLIQSIFLFGIFSIYGRYVIHNSLNTLHMSTTESSELLTRIIDRHINPLKVVSAIPGFSDMNVKEQLLFISNNYAGFYEEIAVVDLNGFAHYNDGSTIDLSDRTYIKEALLGGATLSELLISRKTGETAILSAIPLLRSTNIVGALVGRIDKNSLFEDIKTSGSKQLSQRFIMAADSSVIYSEDSKNKGNIELNENILQKLIAEKQENHVDVIAIEYNNDTYYILQSPIGNYHWTLYTMISEYNLLLPVRNQSYMVLAFSFILSIILMFIAYILLRKAFIPLHELDKLMLKGSEGDFSSRAVIKRSDEIGRLGLSFNILMERINKLTYFDMDTALPNNNVFIKDYKELLNSNRTRSKMGLILIEIDGLVELKSKSTTAYLKLIENSVKKFQYIFNFSHQLYKYTENSFIIIIQNIEDISNELFEETSKSFLSNFDEEQDHDFRHFIYIGYCFANTLPSSMNLIEAVKAATMYARKENCSNIQRFSKKMMNILNDDSEMRVLIEQALELKQFKLYYQPIVSLGEQKIIKAEALIRWIHPEKGMIMPDNFIPVAESSNLIIEIDYYVLNEACLIIKERLLKNLPIFPVSVNITTKTLEQNDFVVNLKNILIMHDVAPCYIEIEITERVVMKRFNRNIETLKQIRSMGIKVSLDDFGIGYSSLSYLSKIPLDYVKIDKSFIEALGEDNMSKRLVKSIIQMCCNLNLMVVAEGVETLEEADFLLNNSCGYAQGYLFSKPAPFTDRISLYSQGD